MANGPSIEEIDAAIKEYFQRALNWSLEFTEVVADDPTFDPDSEAAALPGLIERFHAQLKSNKFDGFVQHEAAELLAPILPSDGKADLSSLRHASRGVVMAEIEKLQRLLGDLTGDYSAFGSGNPRFAGMTATGYPSLEGEESSDQPETLQTIANYYLEFKKKKGDDAKTRSDFETSMRMVYAVIPPERLAQKVTTKDVAAVSDLIGTLPPNAVSHSLKTGISLTKLAQQNVSGPRLAYATQEKRLRFFMSMLRWAKKRGLIADVPGADVRVMKDPGSESSGKPYTEAALDKIFSSPVYVGRLSAARSDTYGDYFVKDAKFWVPIIALFSGMHLGEIIQLRRGDVREHLGVWVFDINRKDDPNKKVKTAKGVRLVPIHRNLKEIGLLDHVHSAKTGERIFSDFKAGKNGYYSHNFSKWWARYGAKHGFHDEHQVFHSFRHCFIDALRDAEAPEYALKAIVGHKDDAVTALYGKGAKMKVLGEVVDRTDFECQSLRELIERSRVGGGMNSVGDKTSEEKGGWL